MSGGTEDRGERYVDRLVRIQNARWKRILDVQAPYRWHLRHLEPGFVLDVGCGIGRNLEHVRGHGVGVDLDPDAVAYVRRLGFEAYTRDEFLASATSARRRFDSILFSHVLEHIDERDAASVVSEYLPFLAPRGRLLVFTPQELGFARDATHVRFFDESACEQLARALSLDIERSYSFPFPRAFGKVFPYNEFVFVLRPRR